MVLARRAYYHCSACGKGHCPADAGFGLGRSDLTAGAEQLAVLFGTTASFAEAAEKLLPKASGLRLAESTIERLTEAAGQRLGKRVRQSLEQKVGLSPAAPAFRRQAGKDQRASGPVHLRVRVLLRKSHWLRGGAHQADDCSPRSLFGEVASVDQTEASKDGVRYNDTPR